MRIEHIGDATLYLGDCLEILPTLDKVDAVVTDPPYGIKLHANDEIRHPAWKNKITGDSTQEIGNLFLKWCETNNLPTAVFASPKSPWPGYWSSYLVWDKGPGVGGGGDIKKCWKQSWELIQVARNRPLNGQRDQAVLHFWVASNLSKDHPAQKPVALLSYLINKITSHGETILDPFMGSGSTGVACANLGRKFIGIEIEEKYFDIACKRIETAYSQPRIFDDLEDDKSDPVEQELGLEEGV